MEGATCSPDNDSRPCRLWHSSRYWRRPAVTHRQRRPSAGSTSGSIRPAAISTSTDTSSWSTRWRRDTSARAGSRALPDGTQQVGLTILGVKPGTHVVSLNNVADNCTVGDANPRSVTIAAGEAASVQFSVVCVATGVAITTHTTGLDQPLAYGLRVDSISRPVTPNDSQVVSRLEPGPHTISLQALPGNCSSVWWRPDCHGRDTEDHPRPLRDLLQPDRAVGEDRVHVR